MAKGLSKTQQELMDKAHRDIDRARNSQDIVEWYRTCVSDTRIRELSHEDLAKELEKDNDYFHGYWKKHYEELLSGIVHTNANGRSLYRLQELGLIEIIEDSTHTFMYDTVKILNY